MKKILTLLVLSGCKKEGELVEVEGEDIFTQEGNYYIFFFKDDSEDTETLKPIIETYNKVINEEADFSHKSKVYAVNLSKEVNKKIYRSYNKEFGQGTNGNFWVNNVTKWDELYINEVPSLISIKTNSQNVTYAEFETSGAEAIYNFLNAYLEH